MVSGSGSESECCVGGSNTPKSPPSRSSPPMASPTRQPLSQSAESPQRNPSDECYSCGRKGHWAQECPNKNPKKSQPGSSSSAMKTDDLPLIRCPCGRGICPVRTSRTERNPGRMYFACPAGRSPSSDGQCNFFLWCDEVADFRAPKCTCGAGSCSLLRESSGPNAGRWYFACRLRKGHGACLFLQGADLKQNNLMNKHLCRSHQAVNAFNSNGSEDKDNLGSEMELEFPLTQNFESSPNSPMMNVDLKQDVHNEVQGNLVIGDGHSCRPMKRNASQISSVVSQSGIYDQQMKLSRQSSTLGKSLNEGIFQSHDPVSDLEDVEMCDSKVSNFSIHNSSSPDSDIQPAQTPPKDRASSRALLGEPSGPKNCTSSVCESHNDRPSECILEACGQGLLYFLESLNPVDHGKMQNVAEVTFDALHRMSLDYGPFSEAVKEFIQCSSKLAEFERSLDKELSSEELIDVCGGKKARYDNAFHQHKEALGFLKASENSLKSLGEEVSRVRGMLCELQEQCFSWEAEISELQGQVAVRYEEMVEAEGSMDAAYKKMEEALELEHQRETARTAAQAALERARRVIKLI